MDTRSLSFVERFLLKVKIVPEGCWLWQGYRQSDGYGRVKKGVGHVSAARVSYEMAHGPAPEGMWILHHCDNPPCVRPSHLFLGTRADNTADKMRKGREARGERMGRRVKLNTEKVIAIRMQYETGRANLVHLGRLYGVHPVTILRICQRKLWKHIP